MRKVTCFISHKEIKADDAKQGEDLQPILLALIQKDFPDFSKDSWISIPELIKYRQRYLVKLIEEESGEIDNLQTEVVHAISHNKILSENIEEDLETKLTLGQKIADHVAAFGGSWTFIIIFFIFLWIWMIANILSKHAFDPYPFIFLNLILSCIAAIQAPVIMMSQNRKEDKDRIRNEHDYKINLKAELEIKMLHEKIDHLMRRQSTRLIEIQEVQTEFLEDILSKVSSK